jgi:uncharacterized protein YodC (DUF2158 family)
LAFPAELALDPRGSINRSMVIKLAKTFVPGDVVVLNSGGPRMTVESVGTRRGKPYVICVFFERKVLRWMRNDPAVLSKLYDEPAARERFEEFLKSMPI